MGRKQGEYISIVLTGKNIDKTIDFMDRTVSMIKLQVVKPIVLILYASQSVVRKYSTQKLV